MAKVTLASYVKSIHGRIGNIVFYNAYDIQYARSYTIPFNPKTPVQQENRNSFGEAVKIWQITPDRERSFYNRLAYGKSFSGYNLFISMQKRGITTEALKLIHKYQRYTRLVHPSYTLRGTSVTASIQSGADRFSSQRGTNILKKPPGELKIAA